MAEPQVFSQNPSNITPPIESSFNHQIQGMQGSSDPSELEVHNRVIIEQASEEAKQSEVVSSDGLNL
jgi:hypothetical protein